MVSVIPRFTEESVPMLGTEQNDIKKISFSKILLQQTCFWRRHALEQNSESFMLRKEIPRVSCFGTEFWEFASIFVPRNRIPSCILFRGMVRNRIPSVQNGIPRVYFCSTVQNPEQFFGLRNGLERNSESFLFRGTAGILSEQTNYSGYSIFPGIFFCRELPTLLPWEREAQARHGSYPLPILLPPLYSVLYGIIRDVPYRLHNCSGA